MKFLIVPLTPCSLLIFACCTPSTVTSPQPIPTTTTTTTDKMWKPGEERPQSGREPKGKKKTPEGSRNSNNSLATNKKSNPAIKRLSSGTMNMRFMQRRTTAVSPKQDRQTSETSHSQTRGNTTSNDVEMADNDDMHADSTPDQEQGFVRAMTAQDMYGTILVGRRSFGSFNPIVDQIYQQSLSAVSKKEGKKRKRKRT